MDHTGANDSAIFVRATGNRIRAEWRTPFAISIVGDEENGDGQDRVNEKIVSLDAVLWFTFYPSWMMATTIYVASINIDPIIFAN